MTRRRAAALLAATLVLAGLRAGSPGEASAAPAREDGGCVALTFDDGPDPVLTPRLLEILERKSVRATFFVVGRNVAAAPGIVGRASADGNEIGNHTYDHRLLTSLTAAEAVDEIALTDKAVIAETGLRPRLIRPPYGIIGVEIADLLRRHGLMRTIALWDVDSFDWLHDDAAQTLATAGAAAPGSVVLLHDIHAGTVAALPAIIDRLRARGLRLATVSGLAACSARIAPDSDKLIAIAPPGPMGPAASHLPSGGKLLGALIEWMRERGPS